MGKEIWVTLNGREIPVKDMETDHILNSIRMLYRNGFSDIDHSKAFLIDTSDLPDGAAMAIEREQLLAMSCPYSPWFKILYAELKVRGIEKDNIADDFYIPELEDMV